MEGGCVPDTAVGDDEHTDAFVDSETVIAATAESRDALYTVRG